MISIYASDLIQDEKCWIPVCPNIHDCKAQYEPLFKRYSLFFFLLLIKVYRFRKKKLMPDFNREKEILNQNKKNVENHSIKFLDL
mgnify:CR=1 FL=1